MGADESNDNSGQSKISPFSSNPSGSICLLKSYIDKAEVSVFETRKKIGWMYGLILL